MTTSTLLVYWTRQRLRQYPACLHIVVSQYGPEGIEGDYYGIVVCFALNNFKKYWGVLPRGVMRVSVSCCLWLPLTVILVAKECQILAAILPCPQNRGGNEILGVGVGH